MRRTTRTLATASLFALCLAPLALANSPSGPGRGGHATPGHPAGGHVTPHTTPRTPTHTAPHVPQQMPPRSVPHTQPTQPVPHSPTSGRQTPKHTPAPGAQHSPKQPATVKDQHGGDVKTANYAASHGMKTKGGTTVYKGHGHQHWTRRHYSHAWRCWCWYDPSTTGWYYWCGERGYYLPVQCLPTLPPSQTEPDANPDDLPPCGCDVTVAKGEDIPDLPEVP